MRAKVPAARVHNEYEAFPPGYYDGNLSGAEVRDPRGEGEWLTLRVSLDNVAAREGTEDPGRTRFNGDITILTDGYDVREIDDFSNDNLPYQIQVAGELLGGIAEGLGVYETEGRDIVFDPEAVISALASGDLEGERLGFGVRNWEDNDGNVRDDFSQFGPAS